MTRLRSCPSCRQRNPAGEPYCLHCGSLLAGSLVHDTDRHPVGPRKRDLRRPAWRESATQSIRATLNFDWGSVQVADSLVIGSDSEHSAIAVRVAQRESGSMPRRHAEVYLKQEDLFVRDVGSTNGTFVNGRRVTRTPHRLDDGDRVAFSNHLVAIVRLRRG